MALNDTFVIMQDMLHRMATHHDGISTAEIARIHNVSQKVIKKYIDIFSTANIPVYEEKQRYYLHEDYFAPFTLTPDESEFLYIILERSLTLHSERWSTLLSLLSKLGSKLTLPLSDYLVQRLDPERNERPADHHFRILAQAKRRRKEVRIEYHPLRKDETSTWIIRPYRFTSNHFSDGLYILCYGMTDYAEYVPLTLKLDRIVDVQMTDTEYSISDLAYFNNTPTLSWNVWNSEREPIEVHLIFEYRHYARLLETQWHPSQRLHVDNDARVHFYVDISEPNEMIPWIRSWGSDVIVQSPSFIRDRITNSLRRQLQNYGLASIQQEQTANPLLYLWAKYQRSSGQYHLLIYHLLDVAAVAWQMWNNVLSQSQKAWLSNILGIGTPQALIAFYVGLHDIGKATPAFQRKASDVYALLLANGFDDEKGHDEPHGILSAVILVNLLREIIDDEDTLRDLALVIGGHHGQWIPKTKRKNARASIGGNQWQAAQQTLFDELSQVLNVSEIVLPEDIDTNNLFCTFLSGFTSVCDWIGSDERYFSYEANEINLNDYFEHAKSQAHTALYETGWLSWQATNKLRQFSDLFPSLTPNAMQQTVIKALAEPTAPPRLILIEYLTGGGKTESALYIADMLINLFHLNGIYVAMPTQATSNQMFGRVANYLRDRYSDQPVNLQLIHGQSQYQPDYRSMSMRFNREGDDNHLAAEVWFQNRRRSLLAPFAVGTIDQAMLSVLQTKHHFVRQFGLSHKVILFDEIHAYDTFMNQIIERLLHWLHALHSPMILLSATLPTKTKQALLAQVGANETSHTVSYPRLTIVQANGDVEVHPLPPPSSHEIALHWLNTNDLAIWLAPIYEQGGCIAVICNTVDEAITVAQSIRHTADILEDDVMLLHARMPFAWRNQIEGDVLDFFGKNGSRPERKILVATQIIEQSLDIDFDLMITPVAPIDMLIQRAGRLHRHERVRPSHLQEQTLIIREPISNENGLPDFGVDGLIYTDYLLLRTWHTLQERDNITIPDDVDSLMETVYQDYQRHESDIDNFIEDALAEFYDRLSMRERGQAYRGNQFLISRVDHESLIGRDSADLPAEERLASTRDMQRGVDIICMSEDGFLGLPIDEKRPLIKSEVETLLQFRITIRKQAILDALATIERPKHWEREAALREAHPIIFTDTTYWIPNTSYHLRIDPFYGLEILEDAE